MTWAQSSYHTPLLRAPLEATEATSTPEVKSEISAAIAAQTVIEQLHHGVWEAQDNMIKAKVSQAQQANKNRQLEFPLSVNQQVRLSMLHWRRHYKSRDEKHVIKFMLRFDGPYEILKVDPTHSTVTLHLPQSPDVFPVFYTSEIPPFIENDETLFSSRELCAPEPINVNGNLEHFIEQILDERKTRGHGQTEYLIRWVGQGPEYDLWLPKKEVKNCEALNIWLATKVANAQGKNSSEKSSRTTNKTTRRGS